MQTITAPDGRASSADRPARPPRFHLLAKPSGSTCNIDCTYRFFRDKLGA